jgi:hypothetical protein
LVSIRASLHHLALAILACCLAGCDKGLLESYYYSRTLAESSGAMARGWLPDWLPKSSTRIHEIHRIEHPRTWCAFDFFPADSEALRARFRSVRTIPASARVVPNPHVSWWPKELTGRIDLAKIRQGGLDLAISDLANETGPSEREVTVFAVDWSGGRGYFFRKSCTNCD